MTEHTEPTTPETEPVVTAETAFSAPTEREARPFSDVAAILETTPSGKEALTRLAALDRLDEPDPHIPGKTRAEAIIEAGKKALARERFELAVRQKVKRDTRRLHLNKDQAKQLYDLEIAKYVTEEANWEQKIFEERFQKHNAIGGNEGPRQKFIDWKIANPSSSIPGETGRRQRGVPGGPSVNEQTTAILGARPIEMVNYEEARWEWVTFETKLFVAGLQSLGYLDSEMLSNIGVDKARRRGQKGIELQTTEKQAYLDGLSDKIAGFSTKKMMEERMKMMEREAKVREDLAQEDQPNLTFRDKELPVNPATWSRNFRSFQDKWRKSVKWRMVIGASLFAIGTTAALAGAPLVTALAFGTRASLSGLSAGLGTTLGLEGWWRKWEERRKQGLGNALFNPDNISKITGHGPQIHQLQEYLAANLAATAEESRSERQERPTDQPEARETEKRLLDEFYRRLKLKTQEKWQKEIYKLTTEEVEKRKSKLTNEIFLQTVTADFYKINLETGNNIRNQDALLDIAIHRNSVQKRRRRILRWVTSIGAGLAVGTAVSVLGMNRAAAAAERAANVTQVPIPGAGGPPTETPPIGPGAPTPSGPPSGVLPPIEPNTPGAPPIAGAVAPPLTSTEVPGAHEASDAFAPKSIEWSHGAGEKPVKVGDWVDRNHVKIGGKTFEVINNKINVGVDINHDGIADAGRSVDIDVTSGRGLYEGHTIQAWDKDVDFDTEGKFDLVARTGRIVDVTGDGKVDIQVWSDDKGLLHANHDINIKGFSLDNQPITDATKLASSDEVFTRAIKFEHFVPHDGVNLSDPAAVAKDIAHQYEVCVGSNYTIGDHGELLNYNAAAEQKLAAYLAKDPSFLEHLKDGKFNAADLQKIHENAVLKGLTAPVAPTIPEPSTPAAPENPISGLEQHIGDWDTLKEIYKTPVPDNLKDQLFEAVKKSNLMDEQNLANLKQSFTRKGVEIFTHSTQSGNIDGIAIHYPNASDGYEFKFPADKAIPKLDLTPAPTPPKPNVDVARDDASRLQKTRNLIANLFGGDQNRT